MPRPELITERNVARLLGVKPATLAAWRDEEHRSLATGSAPLIPAARLDSAGQWCYCQADWRQWLRDLPKLDGVPVFPQALAAATIARASRTA